MNPNGRAVIGELTALVVGEVLGMAPEAVAGARSLFDLPGFDSLAVVAVLERLEADLRVEVPPEQIVPEAFESVDALTSLFAAATAAAAVPFAGGRS